MCGTCALLSVGEKLRSGLLWLRTQWRQQNPEIFPGTSTFAEPSTWGPRWGLECTYPLALTGLLSKEEHFSIGSLAGTSPGELCQLWSGAWSTTCMAGLITALLVDPLWHLVASSLTQWKCTWVALVMCWMALCSSFPARGISWWVIKPFTFAFLVAATGRYNLLICPTNFSVETPWFFILTSLNYTYLPTFHFIDHVIHDFYLEFHMNTIF